QVVAVSAVEDVLRGIEGVQSNAPVPVVRQTDLLQARKTADGLARVILGRVKARELQRRLPWPPLRILEQVDDEPQLIDGFPLPAALAGEIHHPLEVRAEPVSSVTGFQSGVKSLHAQGVEIAPRWAHAVLPEIVREDRHP